jgi:hypothetical protein
MYEYIVPVILSATSIFVPKNVRAWCVRSEACVEWDTIYGDMIGLEGEGNLKLLDIVEHRAA